MVWIITDKSIVLGLSREPSCRVTQATSVAIG
jgi:hypothetical protein